MCTFIINAHSEYLNDLPHCEHAAVLVQAYHNKISSKNQETEDLLVAKNDIKELHRQEALHPIKA